MTPGIHVRLVPVLLFPLLFAAQCTKKSQGFDHDFTFDATTGNVGTTTPQSTADPTDPYSLTVDVTGTDALAPGNVEIVAMLECGDLPGTLYPHPVSLHNTGLTSLAGDLSTTATECIDPTTGQKSSATWYLVVTRVDISLSFKVKIQGTLG